MLFRSAKNHLRDVDITTASFEEMRQSVKENGILAPILARRIQDGDEIRYSLIDGLRRLTAADLENYNTIPTRILEECTDDEAMAYQLIANLHTEKTIRADITRQLTKLSKDRSIAALALQIQKSVDYVRRCLHLEKLQDNILELVNKGKINVGRAHWLAKLPAGIRSDFLESAMGDDITNDDFIDLVKTELRTSKTKPVKTTENWEPTGRFRTMGDIQKGINNPEKLLPLLNNEMTPLEALVVGLKYCIKMDDTSIKERKVQREKVLDLRKNIKTRKKQAQRQATIEKLSAKIKELREENQEKEAKILT